MNLYALGLACCIAAGFRPDSEQPLRVNRVGFADRWADYGSRGDTPSFRDYLAVLHLSAPDERPNDLFIKLRLFYFPQDKSDPASLSRGGHRLRSFNAERQSSCDETFASLSQNGTLSFLDPKLKASRFVHLHGKIKRLPESKEMLPCNEVK